MKIEDNFPTDQTMEASSQDLGLEAFMVRFLPETISTENASHANSVADAPNRFSNENGELILSYYTSTTGNDSHLNQDEIPNLGHNAVLQAQRREFARRFDDTYRNGGGYDQRDLHTYQQYFDGMLVRSFTRELKKLKTLHATNNAEIEILDIGCGHGKPLHEMLSFCSARDLPLIKGTGLTLTPFWHPFTPFATERYMTVDIFKGIPLPSASIQLAVSAAGPQPRDSEEFKVWRNELARIMAPEGVLFYQVDDLVQSVLEKERLPFGANAQMHFYETHRNKVKSTILFVQFSSDHNVDWV